MRTIQMSSTKKRQRKPIEPLESFLTEMTKCYCKNSLDSVENIMANRILHWGWLKNKIINEGCMLSEIELINDHINNLLDALYKIQELRAGK